MLYYLCINYHLMDGICRMSANPFILTIVDDLWIFYCLSFVSFLCVVLIKIDVYLHTTCFYLAVLVSLFTSDLACGLFLLRGAAWLISFVTFVCKKVFRTVRKMTKEKVPKLFNHCLFMYVRTYVQYVCISLTYLNSTHSIRKNMFIQYLLFDSQFCGGEWEELLSQIS